MDADLKNSEIMALLKKHPDLSGFAKAVDELYSKNKSEHEAVKAEYDRLSVIVDLIPNTISWINKDMTYFAVNRALAQACGLESFEFAGKPVGFHTQEHFFEDFAKDLFASSSSTIYREIEAKIKGVEHNYLVSGTKLKDGERAVVIGVDISELKQLQGRVSFTEKLATLGEMFAGIIHDINNPLTMIEGNVYRIKRMTQEPEVVALLDKIDMSSKKITKIIQGIRIYVRQDGTLPFQVENLGQILDDSIVICENKLKTGEVTLKLDPALRQIKINCHFMQLFQVFVNLIVNSIDAIGDKTEKWIEMMVLDDGEKSGMVRIQFMDSGSGIPNEIQEKIFTAFFTTKGRGVGSGLGLSLCTKILEAHGGGLHIDSGKPHTTFIVEIKK